MEVTYTTALLAGILSFLSPCVLPLVPAYISFMTGVSVDNLRSGGSNALRGRAVLHSLSFVLGFSAVFITLGASATILGRTLLANVHFLAKAGGILIVVFGLHYMGLFRIGFLNLEARFNLAEKPPGLWGAFLIGLAFAFGWTPCVGPILAAILTVAGGQESITQGVVLLAVYSAGLGLPFILAGLAINVFFQFFTRIRRHLHRVEVVSGMLLVAVGVLIFFGDLNQLAVLLIQWFPALVTLG